MNLPEIDLNELKRIKEENRKERLEFIEEYVKWLKRTPNKEWSSQRKLMESNSS